MATKQDYIYIQSNRDITVTAGLQHRDLTNKDSDLPNRMKVSPVWPKLKILIKKGRHAYPSYIVEWPTVKALVKDNVITIGESTNDVDDATKSEKAKLDANLKSLDELSKE